MTRFLALIPGGIGDQLLCFPMLASLQQQYPHAQIDVVVEPRAKDAYRVSPVVQQILPYAFQGRLGPADWGNLIGWVREREYDALISLDSSLFGGMMLWLTGVPKRVGYAKQPSAIFMTDTVALKPKQYKPHQYHDLTQSLGVHQPCPPLSLRIPQPDLQWAKSELTQLGITQASGYILIHGGSLLEHANQNPENVYPVASWQALIKGWQERKPDIPVLLAQSPGDRPWFRPLQQSSPGLKVSTPEDLGKMAALMANAHFIITTDCDVLQVAVATGSVLVALMGATDPQQVLPQEERVVVMRSPTGKVTDIAPIQVLEQTWRL